MHRASETNRAPHQLQSLISPSLQGLIPGGRQFCRHLRGDKNLPVQALDSSQEVPPNKKGEENCEKTQGKVRPVISESK